LSDQQRTLMGLSAITSVQQFTEVLQELLDTA
jgi:hypothetical protein